MGGKADMTGKGKGRIWIDCVRNFCVNSFSALCFFSRYAVYDEEAGVENRGRFIIDPDGVIQGYEVLTPPVGRNVNETFRQVKAFQLIRESKGTEATPSGWEPGKMILKPGPELVGNVWKEWKTKFAFE